MNIFLGILLGLLVLTILITSHEFGHFLMARKAGVRVKEFGIGFPPRAIAWVRSQPEKGKKKGKWHRIAKENWKDEQNSLIFSLNWLPIGGFCAMDGESDDETRPGTFGSVNFWKKTKILFGGVTMNFLTAFILFVIVCLIGIPEIFDNQFTIKSDEIASADSAVTVTEVKEGSPAEKAGFQQGDYIISIKTQPVETRKYSVEECTRMGLNADGSDPCEDAQSAEKVTVFTSSDVINFNNAHAGETVIYTVKNAEDACPPCPENALCSTCPPENYRVLQVTLNPQDNTDGYLLGITMSRPSITRRYTWSAPIVAAGLTVQTTAETFKGLGQLVVNLVTGAARQVSTDESVRQEGKEQLEEAGENVSGIVGIIAGYFPNLISAGLTMILLFTAVISVSLACMNILPIPALDGGRWFMIFLCRLRHKKLSKEKEQGIVAKSFIALLILMAIITVLDIIKLF